MSCCNAYTCLSDKERASVDAFYSRHVELHPGKGHLILHSSFASGIGITTTVECGHCHTTEDVTDVECW
jgi:hypothetical protein